MRTCIICRFEVPADDAVVPTGSRCVCLACFSRETGTAKPLPKGLRRVVEGIVEAAFAQ